MASCRRAGSTSAAGRYSSRTASMCCARPCNQSANARCCSFIRLFVVERARIQWPQQAVFQYLDLLLGLRQAFLADTRQFEAAPIGRQRLLKRQRPVLDRESVVEGKSVSVRVDIGGRRFFKKKK